MAPELKEKQAEIATFDPENQITQQDWEDMAKATENCWTDPKAPSQMEMAYNMSIISPDKAQKNVGLPPEGKIKSWATNNKETTIPDLFRDKSSYNIYGDPAVDMHREAIYQKFFPAEKENIQKKEGEAKLTIGNTIKNQGKRRESRLAGDTERGYASDESMKGQFEDDAKLMSMVADARIMYPGRTAQELGLDEKTLKNIEDKVAQNKELFKKRELTPEIAKYLADFKVACPEEFKRMNPVNKEDWQSMNKGLESQKANLAHGNPDMSVRFTMQAAAMKILAAKEVNIGENGLELTMPGQEAQVSESSKTESAPVAEAKEKQPPSAAEREANLQKTLAEFTKEDLADPAIAAEIEGVKKDIEAQKQKEALEKAAQEQSRVAEAAESQKKAEAREKEREERMATIRGKIKGL